ncbi:unnamed protein product [Brassicogethes aeneus]|uniref:Uncharacterized protein n=1 Tax=Brassicogethes aeneus TaxID=1431903 RepID=A0A9P0BHI0_BRAAE|nr:unnamed protein product [Brassicogethes aeneus]
MENICKYCNGKVMRPVHCTVCNAAFYPSCATAGGVINNQEKIVCCQPHESEVNLDVQKKLEIVVEKMLIKHLTLLKQELESSYREEINEIKKTVQFMSDCFDEIKVISTGAINEVKMIKEENTGLINRIQQLEHKINIQEQVSKEKNII